MAWGRVRAKRWAKDRALVIGAVFLLAVPTFFTVIPGWTKWDGKWRVAVLVAWALVAVLASIFDLRRAGELDDLITRRSAAQELAGRTAQNLMMEHPPAPLAGCDLRLYTLDRASGLLVPRAWSSGAPPVGPGWLPGKGAAGRAYTLGELVVARDDDCSDEQWGLTGDQVERFRALRLVSAMPIRNGADRVIGVLTVSSTASRSRDAFREGTPEIDAQVSLCAALGRIIVDLLGYETDGLEQGAHAQHTASR